MYYLKLFALYLALYIAQNHWQVLAKSWSFDKKLQSAQKILESSPMGLKTLKDVQSYGLYRDGVRIRPVDEEVFSNEGAGKVGGIQSGPEGHFEVLINRDLTENDMAHALAHEVQHIRDERISQELLKAYPELEKRIQKATWNLYLGKTQGALKENEKETHFVLYSLFCTELRAYSINKHLEQEGLLPLNSDVKRIGLEKYVMRRYINRYGLKFDDVTSAKLSKECLAAHHVGDYQKNLIGQLFPEFTKTVASKKVHKPSSPGRNPSSLSTSLVALKR